MYSHPSTIDVSTTLKNLESKTGNKAPAVAKLNINIIRFGKQGIRYKHFNHPKNESRVR